MATTTRTTMFNDIQNIYTEEHFGHRVRMLKFNEMTSKHPFFMFMQRCTSCNDKFVATGYRYTSLFIYLFFFSSSAADFTWSTKCVWHLPVAQEVMGGIVFIWNKTNIHVSALPPTVYSLQFSSLLIMLVFHHHIVLDFNSLSVRMSLSVMIAL